MKKMAKLFLVFLLVIGLTGCMKYNLDMGVKDDKSVTLEFVYAIDPSVAEEFEDETVEDEENDEEVDYTYLLELGYEVEPFEQTTNGTTISGVKISKTFENIDDITSDSPVKFNFAYWYADEEDKLGMEGAEIEFPDLKDLKFFYNEGNNYVANFVIDFVMDDQVREIYSQYDESITDLYYKITLPSKALTNNATTVSDDGKELTWNLTFSKVNEVNFSFAFDEKETVDENEVANNDQKNDENKESDNNLLIIFGIGGVVAVVAVVVVIVLSNKKKSNGNSNNTPTTPVNDVPNNNVQ